MHRSRRLSKLAGKVECTAWAQNAYHVEESMLNLGKCVALYNSWWCLGMKLIYNMLFSSMIVLNNFSPLCCLLFPISLCSGVVDYEKVEKER